MSLRKAIEKATKAKEKAIAAIYALAPNGETKFSDCLKLASVDQVEAYHVAQRAEIEAEQAAIDKGRAYRGTFAMLVWTR